jgi:hypothetical protein
VSVSSVASGRASRGSWICSASASSERRRAGVAGRGDGVDRRRDRSRRLDPYAAVEKVLGTLGLDRSAAGSGARPGEGGA